jgi:hypothetical protein
MTQEDANLVIGKVNHDYGHCTYIASQSAVRHYLNSVRQVEVQIIENFVVVTDLCPMRSIIPGEERSSLKFEKSRSHS